MIDRRLFVSALALLPLVGTSAEPPSVAMVVPTGEAQKYWPRWRGPTGQGLALGAGYPDSWSDTENASPALVDGRFYFRTDKELLAIGR